MPLVEIKPPPGFHNHGTDLESEGRWRDGNFVRWHEGSLRPIRGWAARSNAAEYAAPPRGMLAWQDNNASRWIAAGTYNKLYVSTSGGVTSDITPAGLTAGIIDADVNTGYGGGYYGTGYYGQARPDTGVYGEVTSWALDTWGQYLVACSSSDGNLYEWQLDTGTPAAVITNAPTDNLGLVVTEERFLFALGSGGNPRRIAWCDFEDNTLWTPASTNQAGDIIIQTNGQIMCAARTQGQTIIVTDQDAHRAVYVGAPFIYKFERVGTACGAISRNAIADTAGGVYWMGQRGFYFYDGSQVREVPCPIWDRVFKNINTAQVTKSWAVANGQNGEVWFFYPSANSNEIDSYAAYDFHDNHWLVGSIDRTAGVDRGIFRQPVWASSGGRLYDHESGFNYDGSEVFAESGPFRIGAGESLAAVTELVPDEVNLGDVTATFKTRLYPTSAESSHGPYTMANPTSVRFQGRQLRLRLSGNVGGDWRVGKFRFDVKPAGRR